MDQRLSLVTLGVSDLGAARRFYEASAGVPRPSGVFIDPYGHPWEVAHNPGWTLGKDGSVSLRQP